MSGFASQAIEIVQTALKEEGPFNMEILPGGLSESAVIRVNNHIVRFWNMKWAEYFPQDFACQMVASNAGYGPKVIFSDEKACITMMEYFKPEILPELPLRLPALVDLLKKIHTGSKVPIGLDKSSSLSNWASSFLISKQSEQSKKRCTARQGVMLYV